MSARLSNTSPAIMGRMTESTTRFPQKRWTLFAFDVIQTIPKRRTFAASSEAGKHSPGALGEPTL